MDRILIVDDHPLFRDALRLSITQQKGVLELSDESHIVFAASLQEAVDVLEKSNEIGLVLLDLHLPDCQGFLGLIELQKSHPSVAFIVVSGNDDVFVVRKARACGAAGFISKSSSADIIQSAIKKVLMGDEFWPDDSAEGDPELEDISRRIGELTDQQLRVLNYLQDGRLNKQIAYELDISEATVKAHVTAIFRKLGVLNRTQAVILTSKFRVEPPLAV